MKIVRKFLVFILGFLLVNLVGALFISFAIKDIFQTKIIGGVVKENLIPAITENAEIPEEQKNVLNDLLEDKETTEMISELAGELINSLGNEDGQINQNSLNKVFDYIIENKERLEIVTGKPIDVTALNEIRNSEEFKTLSDSMTKSLEETNSGLSEDDKAVIRLYSYVVSDSFRLTILGLIVLCLVLVALLQWSFYKWLIILGRALYVSGIMLVVMYFFVNLIITSLVSELRISIDANLLLYSGIGIIVVGILMTIACRLLNKYFKSKNEVEQNLEIEQNVVS